jgi:hypothetical protein
VVHWLSFEPTFEKIEALFFSEFFFENDPKNHIFKSASKYGNNATETLQNATRCNLKNFGPILKLNLGGDMFLSQKS